jgi:hypothetical protein
MLAFGGQDGFWSLVHLNAEDIAKKCSVNRVETMRLKNETEVLDFEAFKALTIHDDDFKRICYLVLTK